MTVRGGLEEWKFGFGCVSLGLGTVGMRFGEGKYSITLGGWGISCEGVTLRSSFLEVFLDEP